jgi:cytochrome c-type biogenesis protein CcmH/NrfF
MKGVFVLMDGATIMQLNGSYGFPIVACVVMAWFVYDTTQKHRQEVENLNNQHKEEMTEVTKALNNNTLALQRLCDKLDESR